MQDEKPFELSPAAEEIVASSGYSVFQTPLSAGQLRAMFDHSRWLTSRGNFGRQLDLRQLPERRKNNFESKDLDGAELTTAIFHHISFAVCSLREARFTGSEIKGVEFVVCDLRGADFTGVLFENVSFYECNEREAKFDAGVEWNRPRRTRGGISFSRILGCP